MQTRLIFTIFIVWWPWKVGQGHENIINSFNYPNDTIHTVWPESIIWFKKQRAGNLFFGHKLTFKVLVWSWKRGQGHKNLTTSSSCPNGVSMQVWSKSTNWFRRQSADEAHFYSLYSVVTLEIRSRSPKSDHIFKPSQSYNIWSLARIHHLSQEIGCRQAVFGQNLKISKCCCDLENEVKVIKI